MSGFLILSPSGDVVVEEGVLVTDTALVSTALLAQGNSFQPVYGMTMQYDRTDPISVYWGALSVLSERHPVDEITVRFIGMEEPTLTYEAPKGVPF